MSLDISIMKIQPVAVYTNNYTHNVTPMWKLAGVYDALYMSEGMIAGSIVGILNEGIQRMTLDPAAYKALEPANGWGNYDGALRFLMAFRDACELNADGVVEVCK